MMAGVVAHAIGEVFAFGVGVALSPLAIVAVVAMLVAPGGVRPALSFAVGWTASLALVATAVLLAAEGADPSEAGGPAPWVLVVKTVLGLLLLWLAAKQWRGRADDEGGKTAALMRKMDGIEAVKAAGVGVLFTVKPKNLLLAISAGLSLAPADSGPAVNAVALAVFVLIGSAGAWLPLALRVISPERGHAALLGLRDWMVRENATVIVTLCLVFAAKLLGDVLTKV